ncbi:hypothetical protein J41TS12_41730 [Paenibacillus antibioticophila]|uniref:Uncharacterized protein n=1 Tax=Paenibacillus antibioticophila TaxID=1274374 RepID=A0A920CJV2_9BACL|nr:hypothetical protein [Paenibacillus antibioticophila]GIO39312.1 hypothetical protein J41TS12_41730 [Paenibacillus antibioticophila]
MFSSFKRAFRPTEIERSEQAALLKSLEAEQFDFWRSRGFSDQEINKIMEREVTETNVLRGFQTHVGKRQLLESGLTTVEEIKASIH